jgi:hypothetical protein
MLVFASTGQQIGSVDLTVPLKALKPAENQEQKAPPNGCDKLSDGIIADGWAEPPDRRPLDLVVEVTKVNDANPVIGSELQAEVRMRNGDTRTIEIPWSTDHSIVEAGQNPESLQWNAGTFEFMLRIPHVTQVRLKSLTGWLYSSKFSAGSQLTIQPGESITALVKLKLEDEYAIPPRATERRRMATVSRVVPGRPFLEREGLQNMEWLLPLRSFLLAAECTGDDTSHSTRFTPEKRAHQVGQSDT